MKCKRCKVDKPETAFYKSTRAKSGLQTYCKSCTRNMTDPVLDKIRARRYMDKHPARVVWRHLHRRAHKNGGPCMTRDEFEAWYVAQSQVCVYCKATAEEAKALYGHALHIDRKDAGAGYVLGNMCLACHRCNVVKNRYLTYEQMLDVADRHFAKLNNEGGTK